MRFGCSWDFCCSSRPAWSLGTDGAEVLPQTSRPVGPDGHHGNDHDARASPRLMNSRRLLIATQILFQNSLEGFPFSSLEKAGRLARAVWVNKVHLAPDVLRGANISRYRDFLPWRSGSCFIRHFRRRFSRGRGRSLMHDGTELKSGQIRELMPSRLKRDDQTCFFARGPPPLAKQPYRLFAAPLCCG